MATAKTPQLDLTSDAAPVAVRLLMDAQIDGLDYRANTLVMLPAAQAAQFGEAGICDPHPDAVAHLQADGVQVIEHVPDVTAVLIDETPAAA